MRAEDDKYSKVNIFYSSWGSFIFFGLRGVGMFSRLSSIVTNSFTTSFPLKTFVYSEYTPFLIVFTTIPKIVELFNI